jgi:glycerophosphoryl diester phosphodiesterase
MSVSSPASTASKIMAHRGGRHGGAPNSVDAIAHACDVGAESAEIDVNQTKDGVLVATHDAIITSASWIAESTFDDLLGLDHDDWTARRLENVIDYTLSRSAMAYLDLKTINPDGLKQIAQTWPDQVASGEIFLASARGDVIAWIGTNIPTATSSFLYYDRLLDVGALQGYMEPTYVHPCFDYMPDPFRSMNESYVDRVRSFGFKLVSWSENDPERVAHLAELGFDYICTDEPELSVDVVKNRVS